MKRIAREDLMAAFAPSGELVPGTLRSWHFPGGNDDAGATASLTWGEDAIEADVTEWSRRARAVERRPLVSISAVELPDGSFEVRAEDRTGQAADPAAPLEVIAVFVEQVAGMREAKALAAEPAGNAQVAQAGAARVA